MRFPPSGGIAGSVLLDDSVGLELVKLRLVYSENHWVSLPRLNAFARFEKTGLHLGEARLDVLFDDEVVHTVSSVHIAQGVTRRIPAIDLRSIVRAVGITVTDAEGRPLSRAEVRTVPVGEETETRISVRPIKADADGRISIPWPKDANEVWVSAHHGGKLHGISRIDLTGPEVVAHLTTPAPIRVHIPESVDLGNGGELTLLARPLHEKTRKLIAIFNKGPDGNVTTMRPISSNERTHVFRLPLPGRYDVQARLQVPGEAPVEIADETRLVVGKKPIDLPRR